MKRLLLLISFSILCLISFAQTNVQQDNRINPILRSALNERSAYYIYGRTGASKFINIALLNQSSHTLCWFTCHGRLFDSTKLTGQEFEQITSKQLDPFVLYQNICDEYLANIAAAKDIYRVYGDIQLFEKLKGNYHALFAMETVQAAKTSLQKLIAIENVRKKILTQLAYLNCANPSSLSHDPLYATNKEQAGIMVKTNDSTVYYNIDPISAVAKISLYKKFAGQFYVQNRFSEIIDSVAIQPEKYDLLQKEKTDVFLLYRGWLEMQWQGGLSAIRRQSAGQYNQVNVQNEKEVKELYKQLNAIGAKINQLNSPEAKSIEQAVYDIYKNETSEISYIPLLGMGYNLIQTRGQKEYELNNHLGNVLAIVSDKKIGVSSTSNSSLIDHYEPDIVSAQDYFPFGMLQPGRSFLSSNGNKYRYGFNGKENDNEVKGEGNQQDYGMRVYDPRLGKFLSTDPLKKDYPELTPYQFASNRPIDGIDLDGEEFYKKNISYDVRTGKFSIIVGHKVNVSSSAAHVNVNLPQVANQLNDKFKAAFEGVYDSRRGISYSAEGEVTINQENAPMNVMVGESAPYAVNSITGKKQYITGNHLRVNTLKNTIYSAVAMMDESESCVLQVMSDEYVALTAVHEGLHTGEVYHPFDPQNTAEDVDLERASPVRGKVMNFQPARGADIRMIRTNIMMYTSTSVNGSRITDATKLNKISPDQALVFIKAIANDRGEQYEDDKKKTP
jgi:RHS repeat-associated protein